MQIWILKRLLNLESLNGQRNNFKMSSNIKIRRAKKEDIPKILALGRKTKEFSALGKTRFYSKKEVNEFIKNPGNNILLVALQEYKLIGFTYSKIITSEWCLLESIAIISSFKRKGIATLLFNKLHLIIKNRGIDIIEAYISPKNKNMRRFCKKFGFKEIRNFILVEKDV